jgi:hypothetical protein
VSVVIAESEYLSGQLHHRRKTLAAAR